MTPKQAATRLRGAMAALPTPFRGGEVDLEGLARLVRWQLEQGVDGIVPCGTTGEAPTLSWEERLAILRCCIGIVRGKVPVIAGTGTNNTEATIAFTAAAEAFGADAALIVTPYYNKPSQEGIFRHYEAIASKVNIPIVVYNVPSRTGVDLLPETVARLAQIPTIVGIKDATGDLDRPSAISRQAGNDFLQFSGHDATAFGFNTMGGVGTISVVANVAPRLCADMHNACRRGDHHTARAIQHHLRPLIAALELESNPVPVKYALHLLLGLSPDVRLPLVPATTATQQAVQVALLALSQDESDAAQAKRAAAGGRW
ncbi:4-hydroxy-tetrahydrodipicolinate synthase [Mesorhizobium albiziae]|uniref:4-hydroxy-tetrahydrodipicolinate synthase n=1 Tax=Neomesorhizobium albiziae TaxID=335020 RepID=A0A1I3V005_9HYPH|nr:4-hydroxy-tetrahydrodipicolinate synthase [Mesorhizobium albiziae]GLS28576.1 4-hydroxy-tetrahydrodipicolinate synthase [Mesorhizobium albiziae]SFJ88500.1 4-hydroxy-tetrahydrodipicolinate synthase [Mesorhizobium albiziae]